METSCGSRVDEFFPAKKRRCFKSDASPSKLDAQMQQAIPSPSKKSTLDSYLVTTQNGRSPLVAQNSKKYQLPDEHPLGKKEQTENCGSKCMDAENKIQRPRQQILFSLRRCSQECSHASAIKTKGEESLKFLPGQDEYRSSDVPFVSDNVPKVTVTNVFLTEDDEGKKNGDDEGKKTEDSEAERDKHKHELTQFANDFLSMCCSGIDATSKPTLTSTKDSSTFKCQPTVSKGDLESSRDGPMVGTHIKASKQIEAMWVGNTWGEGSNIMDGNKSGMPTDIKMQDVVGAVPSSVTSPEMVIKVESTFESPEGTMKSSRSSLSDEKRKTSITPQASRSCRQKRMPGWTAGNSLFSPGDEFWDEAIYLVDGLVSNKVNDASRSIASEAASVNGLDVSPMARVCMSSTGGKEIKGLKDIDTSSEAQISKLNAESAITPLTDPSIALLASNMYGRVCYDGHNVFNVLKSEVSPFPVRRFDFHDNFLDIIGSEGVANSENASSKLETIKSGRSSVGEQLSMIDNKAKVDLDEAVCNVCESSPSEGFQKKSVEIRNETKLGAVTSVPNSHDLETKLEFSNWLPVPVCSVYGKKGLKKLYPWQVSCLQLDGVLEGKNLVYCASTSAGKSLVAEILLLRQVLSAQKKALLVLPYVSICSEKCVEHPLNFSLTQLPGNSPEGKCCLSCTINPRDFFLPSQEDWLLLSADYSQIEVRLMAHFSGDTSLIELLSRPSGDLFKIITARWTGVDELNVTVKQREHTKRLVYGILYGMGTNALADQLECSVSEAAEKHNRFKAAFPGVAKWLKEAVKDCREKGYITTLAGRKRHLDKIKYGSLQERAKAERQAVNSICQGSAADLIKVAMIKLVQTGGLGKVRSANDQDWKSSYSLQGKYRLLLQIHDELLLEVESTVLRKVGVLLRSCMESAASLQVPLRVKLKYGPKWGSLLPMHDI